MHNKQPEDSEKAELSYWDDEETTVVEDHIPMVELVEIPVRRGPTK